MFDIFYLFIQRGSKKKSKVPSSVVVTKPPSHQDDFDDEEEEEQTIIDSDIDFDLTLKLVKKRQQLKKQLSMLDAEEDVTREPSNSRVAKAVSVSLSVDVFMKIICQLQTAKLPLPRKG